MFKLIGIGDNNIDTYKTSGISYAGGNCVNVAVYASLNGYPSGYIGVVGPDELGRHELDSLKALQVDVSHARVCDGVTSGDIVVVEGGDRIFTCYDRTIIDGYPLAFDAGDLSYINGFDVIHSSIYSVFVPGEFEKLCGLGKIVSYDFSIEWDDACLKKMCPLVQYSFLSCSHISEKRTIEALKNAVDYGSAVAVGTRGLDGSLLYDGAQLYRQRAYETSVVDTLGAGDSFIARFLLTYLEGIKLLERCRQGIAGIGYAENDLAHYLERLSNASLSQAALFAAWSCQKEGAFGGGKQLI